MQRSQAGKYNDEKQLNQTRRLRSGKEMPEQKNKNWLKCRKSFVHVPLIVEATALQFEMRYLGCWMCLLSDDSWENSLARKDLIRFGYCNIKLKLEDKLESVLKYKRLYK